MAMQARIGLSKVVLLVGTGFTFPILLRNGHLANILLEIQDMLEKADNSDYVDTITTQVCRLAMEVQLLASEHQRIIIETRDASLPRNIGSLVVPAAAIGGLGCGYMWWKGISFLDFMYLTRKNLTTAVDTMTGQIKHLVNNFVAAKKHLTQRMGILDWKLDEQKEHIKEIKIELSGLQGNLDEMNSQIHSIYKHVMNLNETCFSMEEKQKFMCWNFPPLQNCEQCKWCYGPDQTPEVDGKVSITADEKDNICRQNIQLEGKKDPYVRRHELLVESGLAEDGSNAPRKSFLESTGSKALQQISYNMKAIMNNSDASGNLKTLTRGLCHELLEPPMEKH